MCMRMQDRQCVLLSVFTNNDTLVKTAVIFAELLFEVSFVALFVFVSFFLLSNGGGGGTVKSRETEIGQVTSGGE